MLLRGGVGWSGDTDGSFEVSVTDAGRTVRAEVLLDDDGRPRDFRTEDRFADLPAAWCRRRGAPPSTDGPCIDGRPRPTGAPPSGICPTRSSDTRELALADLALDVPPGR